MGTPLTSVNGIGPAAAAVLEAHGLTSAEQLAASVVEDLVRVPGFGPVRAATTLRAARSLVEGRQETGGTRSGNGADRVTKKANNKDKKKGKKGREKDDKKAQKSKKDKKKDKNKGKKKGKKKDKRKTKKDPKKGRGKGKKKGKDAKKRDRKRGS